MVIHMLFMHTKEPVIHAVACGTGSCFIRKLNLSDIIQFGFLISSIHRMQLRPTKQNLLLPVASQF